VTSDDVSWAVRGLLEAGVRAGAFPGAAAAWQIGDGVAALVHSGASSVLPRRTDSHADVFFDLASLTKPLVTATLAVLAGRKGALDLSTRVGEVLPQASAKRVGEATVRHLLTHTSGLPSWAPLYALGDPAEVEHVLLELALEASPGSRVVYSCPGFILLGRMLERVLGGSLTELLKDRILGPLGLATSLGPVPDSRRFALAGAALTPRVEQAMLRELGLDPGTSPALAPGLPDDGNARFLGGMSGNSGLWGTAAGVLELARHHLPGRSSLLTDDELDLMAAGATPGMEQKRGLGWQLSSSPGCSAGPSLSPGSFGHTGFTGCSLWIDRQRAAVLVLLSNRHHPGHRDLDLHPLRRRFHTLVLG